jgi:hypothetical protein
MVLLGLDEDAAAALAESGALVAFDLSLSSRGKRKIHVWRDSLLAYSNLSNTLSAVQKTVAATRQGPGLQACLSHMLPALGKVALEAATVRLRELAWRWCVCPDQIRKLVQAGELRETNRRSRRGSQAAYVQQASVFEFLKRRYIA